MKSQELTHLPSNFILVADHKRRKYTQNMKTICKIILTTCQLISHANISLKPDSSKCQAYIYKSLVGISTHTSKEGPLELEAQFCLITLLHPVSQIFSYCHIPGRRW